MRKRKNPFMLGVALILFFSTLFFMSYMRIDSDEIDSLYNSYFRSYRSGDFRSINSTVVSWESYVSSIEEGIEEGTGGSITPADRGSLLSILRALADFYINEVGEYHMDNDHPFYCRLVGRNVRPDCSGFASTFASMVSNVDLPTITSTTMSTALPQSWIDAGWRLYSASEVESVELGDIIARPGHVEVSVGAQGVFGWGKPQTQFPSRTSPPRLENGKVLVGSNDAYTHIVRFVGVLSNPESAERLPDTEFGDDWQAAVESHYGNTGRSANWKAITHLGKTYAWEKQSAYNVTSVDGSSLNEQGCMWFSMACAWSALSGEVHGVDDCFEAVGYTVDRSNVNAFRISPQPPKVGLNSAFSHNGIPSMPDRLLTAITGYNVINTNGNKNFEFANNKLYLVHVINDSSHYLSNGRDGEHWFIVLGEDGDDYLLLNASGSSATTNRVSKSILNSAELNWIFEITK